ncbi:MAG: restriction endonuclease [Flavobacteriales bacterium]|nr:MAG: restriction endonuclease [Flavobacteriales bacterium]
MELKPYQQRVIDDLGSYLDHFQHLADPARTYNSWWEQKAGPYDPLSRKGMRPYQDNVPGAIHLCVKVPTAGGKTFIAVNALKTIFDHYGPSAPRAVVWLVPWSNLLQQTVRTLSDPEHPYRQKLNQLFRNRVEVYEKDQLLMGAGFSPTSVQEQLSIIVMSFASLRARRKEDRKVFQENGQLAGFRELYGNDTAHIKPGTDDTALINVIRHLNPVVVVDESHNAESDLSVDMLKDLNPSFVLDLTATPKQNSNIIGLVPALELKKEHMVKLPVIVYNQHHRHEVIENALHLRQRLQAIADQEHQAGGKRIRPIVLFQAQPRTGEENVTFEKVKHLLMQAGIPEAEIRIKTADKDELKGVDLMAPDCPVKYIITINALKEGWDCPYAYILASLADKSSAVDVEQILGRVLRQPFVMRHSNPMLNMSYVLTASAKFQDTLQGIVKALQESGFSDKDYRAVDTRTEVEKEQDKLAAVQTDLLGNEAPADDLDLRPLTFNAATAAPPATPDVSAIEQQALARNAELEAEVQRAADDPEDPILQEMGDQVYRYSMRDDVAALAKGIRLPRFVVQVPGNIFTGDEASWDELSQEPLLKDFRLSAQNTEIDWESIESELYAVDLEGTTGGQVNPAFRKILQSEVREPVMAYILAKPAEARLNDVADQVLARIGDMWPIADQELKRYVVRLLEQFSTEQLHDVLQRPLAYTSRIRRKVQGLADAYAEQRFKEMLQVGKLRTEPQWRFSEKLVPGRLGPSIANSLYEREGEMNNFEARAISELGGLSNIACWHRNLGRGKGFSINGYSNNHYPDFILLTKSGKVIVLETKGDDRDNSDSAAKARLGKIWQDQCGPHVRYFMVFDQNRVEGAYTLADAKRLVGEVG